MQTDEETKMISSTVAIVVAYVSNNSMRREDVPEFCAQVFAGLRTLGQPEAVPAEALEPAVPIKKSVHHDYLISLEDGQKYKSLRRHLSTRGLTPDEYRTKWGLPKDYPMVCASYSEVRSRLAKTSGLGRVDAVNGNRATAPAADTSPAPVVDAAPTDQDPAISPPDDPDTKPADAPAKAGSKAKKSKPADAPSPV